ncbi:hypothetical protein BST14_18700 [Mycobacterium arosiense ATCC BAA-1401 = DSM 45069]|uniref:DUF3298 domain-containing protein n=1 Tax=Mycobacterium arosiense ATCC BAA-1401 = DSM 45069 TaxID=1265311 RepID=A0A1W9ZBU8_MYCAI|nr:hypothetical protein BST14_18700 [Mycobacterium arosiense ATCC BAA-1401 = DSM 45069]
MRVVSAAAAVVLVGSIGAVSGVAVAAAKSACAEMGGNIQSGNICHVNETTPAYVIDLRFSTDYPDQQAVTGFLAQERSRLIGLAQTPGAQRLPYNLYNTFELFSAGQSSTTSQQQQGYGQPPHGTESLLLVEFFDAEGSGREGKNTPKTFTYDLNSNRPVTFDELFVPGSNPIDKIYPAVATDLARQQKARNFHLDPNIGRNPAHYQNFAVTDDAVTFFFSAGEFFPAEAGDTRTVIPRALLPPLQI